MIVRLQKILHTLPVRVAANRYWPKPSQKKSIQLHPTRLHHLAPARDFSGDQGAEGFWGAAQGLGAFGGQRLGHLRALEPSVGGFVSGSARSC
jgi:hypothetical protein